MTTRDLDASELGTAVAIGARGVRYDAGHEPAGTCTISSSVSSEPLAAGDRCTLRAASSSRFTVAAFGRTIYRLRGARAVPLHAMADQPPVGLAADRRGRALVLASDGSLHRFSAREAPAVLYRPR